MNAPRRSVALLLAVSSALLVTGCNTHASYWGYNSSYFSNWAQSPSGQGNAARAAAGGANAAVMSVDECLVEQNYGDDSTYNNGVGNGNSWAPGATINVNGVVSPGYGDQFNALVNAGINNVVLRLDTCHMSGQNHPLAADSTWNQFVNDAIQKARNAQLTVVAAQVLNEPNSISNWPAGTTDAATTESTYASFFNATRSDLSATAVKVISAGMSPLSGGNYEGCPNNGADFTTGPWICPNAYLIATLNTYHMNPDGIGAHLYPDTGRSDVSISAAENDMETEYTRLSNHSGSLPIWVTEMGAVTGTNALNSEYGQISPQHQGDIGIDVTNWLDAQTYAIAYFGWDLSDAGNVQYDQNGNVVGAKRAYGVLDRSNNPKGSPASGGAYCRLAAKAQKSPPSGC